MPNEILNITVTSRDEAVIHSRARRIDHKVPFTMYGNGLSNRNGKSLDIADVMCDLTDGPRNLLRAMIKTRNVDSNQVRHQGLIARDDTTVRAIGNHMPVLIEQGYVKRIQRGLYMINPLLVLPPDGTAAKAMWNSLIAGDRGTTEDNDDDQSSR